MNISEDKRRGRRHLMTPEHDRMRKAVYENMLPFGKRGEIVRRVQKHPLPKQVKIYSKLAKFAKNIMNRQFWNKRAVDCRLAIRYETTGLL